MAHGARALPPGPARCGPSPPRSLNRWPGAADAAGVSEALDSSQTELPELRSAVLPRLGESLPAIVQRFSVQHLLGLVVVDGSALAGVEGRFGYAAGEGVMANLAALVREVLDREGDRDEFLVSGETGRHEILVLLFRASRDAGFYDGELPGLCRSLQRAFEESGQRLVYPYSRRAPRLATGFAAAIRNPHLGVETQLRSVLEEARTDAALMAGAMARRRRKALMSVLMAGDLSSVYEPIVDVQSRTVFGYEALVRGPAGGELHSPAALFESAEEEDLIFELDCLCRKVGLDGAEGLPSGTRLFLNVRPTTIHDPAFRPDALIRTLERCRLRPSEVDFEISEQESIQSFDVFREIRDEYKSLGFQFALDDTGAGYASLQTVIELEPEFIKVDRALVTRLDTDPAKQLLLKALQEVAGGLGARIIGEGLDTLEELGMLGELGIPFGQGWLFGKPTPLRA